MNTGTTLKTIATGILTFLMLNTALGQVPTANFTATPLAGCAPLVVQFQDLSTGGPTVWSWDFGNGATSTLQNPATTYFNPGRYTIRLTVTNPNGTNTLTRTQYITVHENPTVNFSANNTAGCFPLRVQFTDLSTAGSGSVNTNWFWDLGNGTQSTQQNPQVTYTTAGNFTITLKVTNDKGCSKVLSRPNMIQVTPGVKSSFTHTEPQTCRPPAVINFTNTSTGPGTLTYSWNFGDGNTSTLQNPSHTYTTSGTYTVSLATTSSAGCVDTVYMTETVVIGGINTNFLSPDSVCVNTNVGFVNASAPGPVSSFWDFGDGATATTINATHAFATPGTYLIKLVNTYSNCVDSVTKTLFVRDKPASAFSAPVTTKCQPPLTVNFQDNSTGAVAWQWMFGDGNTSTSQNPTHTYTSYGSFDVTLITTNSNGCRDTLRQNAFVRIARPQITVSNLPVRGCVPYTIYPVPNVVSLDNVTSWFWDFGDGNTSTLQNPSHTYPNQGTYTIKLRITTSTGCTDSLVISPAVTVGTRPNVNFSAQPRDVCAFEPVMFDDLSAPADQWLWQFGDGGSSTLPNPIHMYEDTGFFNVTLTVWNNGCPDSLTMSNYIHIRPPIALFSYTTNCNAKRTVVFTDQSVGANTWFWEFGDGNTSTSPNPVHTYAAYGNYTIRLTVTNDTCSHTREVPLTLVDATPNFVADRTVLCKTGNVRFTSNVSLPNIVNHFWDFGNGTTSSSDSPITFGNYSTSGNFTVTLITTDINGCRDTVVKPQFIRVNGPEADFAPVVASGCAGMTTTFNDLSTTDGVNNIVSWRFDFGDGIVQNFTAPPFTHVYANVGNYSVKLTITDAAGCVDSVTSTSMITTSNPTPLFNSIDTLTCPGGAVRFENESFGTNLTYLWSFGDGVTDTAANPVHGYMNPGIYTVILQVIDSFGCVDSMVRDQYITVGRPTAAFTVNDSISSCTPFEVVFTNTSQYYVSSHWDFGGGTSSLTDPIFYFSIPGIYDVKLYVTSPGGCVDSTTRRITIYDTAGSRIDYLPLNGCKPLPVTLNATTTGIYTFLWDYGDGVIDTTAGPNMSHVYDAYGNFVPKVILRDPAGCLVPVTGLDTIRIRGAEAKFGMDTTLVCDSGFVNFIDSTTFNDNVVSYHWDFGDGNTSNLSNPTHFYSGPGFYTVMLAVQTVSGCTDTLTKPAIIKLVESPLIAVGGDSTACVFERMTHIGQFQRIDTSVVTWSWVFPNGNSSTLQNPPQQVYTTAGNFNITTVATNSSGCKDTVLKPIIVYPLPTVTMPGVLTIQAGFPVQIPATYTPNVMLWNWVPATGLNCSDCPTPVAGPRGNTKYSVSFVDSNGCANRGEIEILVFCKNANVFIPNTFSPNGDGSNEVFYARGRGLDRIKLLRIFNRWGEVVFESRDFPVNDPSVGWNGMYKGKKAQPDVYVYQVEVFCTNGEIIRFNGNIALIQ